MLRIVTTGVDTYADFAPGWTRPPRFDEANEQRLERVMPEPTFVGLMAEADGKAIAYVILWQAYAGDDPPEPIEGLAHLSQLFVLPDWWGTGVATELLDQAVSKARGLGFGRMRLFTPRDHERARRFYEREGWRPTGDERFGPELGLQIVEYAIDL
jgi:GNAT superfamily N-acetyltransferase